jgi:glycosyltransferase involved in cell wall biosynthesis
MSTSPQLISFVVPLYNEEGSLIKLFAEIGQVMSGKFPNFSWETVFVDDGSTDGSFSVLKGLASQNPGVVKVVRLRANSGKAAALAAGFSVASGAHVVTLDADLQDDPNELPKLFAELDKGFDLVSGWKQLRHDPLSRTLPSRVFNSITCWCTGLKLNDMNSGFKLYRKKLVESLPLYGHRHRYIPVLAADLGFKVSEVAVNHRKREFGASKYGMMRFLHGFVDLLSVLLVTRFLRRPAHLFGGIGFSMGVIGLVALSYLFVHWMFSIAPIGTRPLLFFGITMLILAVQFISFGLLAELMVANSDAKKIEERIAEIIGSDELERTGSDQSRDSRAV